MKNLAFIHYLRVGHIQPKKPKRKGCQNILFLVKKLSYTGKESKTTAYSTAQLVEKNLTTEVCTSHCKTNLADIYALHIKLQMHFNSLHSLLK